MNRDFSDMLSALSGEGAEFLVVGAYALAMHGAPRATGDIDIWVRPTPANAAKVLAALRRFGAPLMGLVAHDLEVPGTVFQIGVQPSRIDIMTAIDAVGFEEAWATRVTVERDGLPIPFIDRAFYLRNKRAVGRAKDLADIEALERIVPGGSTPPSALP